MCRFTTPSVSGQCRSVMGPQVDRQNVFSMYYFSMFFDCWSILKLTGFSGQ